MQRDLCVMEGDVGARAVGKVQKQITTTKEGDDDDKIVMMVMRMVLIANTFFVCIISIII